MNSRNSDNYFDSLSEVDSICRDFYDDSETTSSCNTINEYFINNIKFKDSEDSNNSKIESNISSYSNSYEESNNIEKNLDNKLDKIKDRKKIINSKRK